jgi:hypothetical protein
MSKLVTKIINVIFLSVLILSFQNTSVNTKAASRRPSLLPSENVIYSPNKENSKVFGKEDLIITMQNFSDSINGSTCKLDIVEYGSSNATIISTKTSTVQNQSCQFIFEKQAQTEQGWEMKLTLENSNGTSFIYQNAYLFKLGAISVVEVGLK